MIKLLKETVKPKTQIDPDKYDAYFGPQSKNKVPSITKFSKLPPGVQSSFAPVLDGLGVSPNFVGLKVNSADMYEKFVNILLKTSNNFVIEIIYMNNGRLTRARVYRVGGNEIFHPAEWIKLNYDPEKLVAWINAKAEKLEHDFRNRGNR